MCRSARNTRIRRCLLHGDRLRFALHLRVVLEAELGHIRAAIDLRQLVVGHTGGARAVRVPRDLLLVGDVGEEQARAVCRLAHIGTPDHIGTRGDRKHQTVGGRVHAASFGAFAHIRDPFGEVERATHADGRGIRHELHIHITGRARLHLAPLRRGRHLGTAQRRRGGGPRHAMHAHRTAHQTVYGEHGERQHHRKRREEHDATPAVQALAFR